MMIMGHGWQLHDDDDWQRTLYDERSKGMSIVGLHAMRGHYAHGGAACVCLRRLLPMMRMQL
jgi:hypothetical protein